MTWATSVPTLVFLGLSFLDLGPMYATDRRQTEKRQTSDRHRLMARLLGAGHNNNHDDIYSVVIMTEVIARVHSVHLVNVEQRQAAADPQTKPSDLAKAKFNAASSCV